MNDTERQKLKRFISDPVLSGVVKKMLETSFRKKRADRDVHNLAAQQLAGEYLSEAWKELERIKRDNQVEIEREANIGL